MHHNKTMCFCLVLLAAAQAAPLGAAHTVMEIRVRLAAEAEKFQRIAPTAISEEVLEQKTRTGTLPINRPANVPEATPAFESHEITSEYGFASLKESPNAIHELRKVITADGVPVTTLAKARYSMTLGLSSTDDKLKKRLLEDFEKHGLHGAAADFGQLILLFSERRQQDFDFRLAGEKPVGPDVVEVVEYTQIKGNGGLTVFRGNQVQRQPLRGEIWVRKADGVPLRITMLAASTDKNYTIRDESTVEYGPSSLGALLPLSVVFREYLNQELLSEAIYSYAPFRQVVKAKE